MFTGKCLDWSLFLAKGFIIERIQRRCFSLSFGKYLSTPFTRHGVKLRSGSWDPGPWDPPQSLKVGPLTPLKFKSGIPGPSSKFKSGTPGPPSKFKSGTPHLSLKNSLFSEYFILFFTNLFLCLL